ncbi:MAG: 50S ribosomal protein L11 methyltransferase [Deltaproteobacteria bacterium]|nr:50S ribosomal protein L11 methyltransferase [Deltaproteobacteria bacterium]
MSDSPSHPFVTIQVRPDQLELAQLRLWELGASGLEERDETTLVCESAPGRVVVIAAFPDEAAAHHALKQIREEYEAEILYVPSQDWATEWRRGFGAQRIGKRLLLHPSWEAVRSESSDVVLTIDPENAFGSGDHETTRLVLQMLDQRVAGGERVLDVGCGSGVLSIAALRLGAASAVAVDIDGGHRRRLRHRPRQHRNPGPGPHARRATGARRAPWHPGIERHPTWGAGGGSRGLCPDDPR